MANNKGYYAVFEGYEPGIYCDWPSCHKQVKGFSKAKYKRYDTRDEAESAMHDYCGWVNPSKRKPSKKKKRLNVEMTEKICSRINVLKRQTEASSQIDVIRKALAIYDHIVTEQAKSDAKVILRKKDGSEETLVIL